MNPHQHVVRLAARYGLLSNILPVASFSRARTVRDDGVVYSTTSVEDQARDDVAFEDAIALLAHLARHAFDLVLLDGHHEADYLRKEIDLIGPMMKPGAIAVLDDVDQYWADLQKVY